MTARYLNSKARRAERRAAERRALKSKVKPGTTHLIVPDSIRELTVEETPDDQPEHRNP